MPAPDRHAGLSVRGRRSQLLRSLPVRLLITAPRGRRTILPHEYRSCDHGDVAKRPQCRGMMNFSDLASVSSDHPVPRADPLRLAVAAYRARFKGSSREHTQSDLRSFLTWCAEHGLDPLAARLPHLELCIRWMQEIRRFKPSTASRRF
jgi:hypothetical protein